MNELLRIPHSVKLITCKAFLLKNFGSMFPALTELFGRPELGHFALNFITALPEVFFWLYKNKWNFRGEHNNNLTINNKPKNKIIRKTNKIINSNTIHGNSTWTNSNSFAISWRVRLDGMMNPETLCCPPSLRSWNNILPWLRRRNSMSRSFASISWPNFCASYKNTLWFFFIFLLSSFFFCFSRFPFFFGVKWACALCIVRCALIQSVACSKKKGWRARGVGIQNTAAELDSGRAPHSRKCDGRHCPEGPNAWGVPILQTWNSSGLVSLPVDAPASDDGWTSRCVFWGVERPAIAS